MVLKTAPSRVQSVSFAVWCACKAPSRNQWYPKTAPSRAQCVFSFFSSCRPHTRGPSKQEIKKEWSYSKNMQLGSLELGSTHCIEEEAVGLRNELPHTLSGYKIVMKVSDNPLKNSEKRVTPSVQTQTTWIQPLGLVIAVRLWFRVQVCVCCLINIGLVKLVWIRVRTYFAKSFFSVLANNSQFRGFSTFLNPGAESMKHFGS